MSYRRDNTEDEHIPLPIETVELAIDDFFEYYDLFNINSVDELRESLHDYLYDIGIDIDFNLNNIINYYNINDLNELNNRFIASYDDDVSMDKKIQLIYKCIELMINRSTI